MGVNRLFDRFRTILGKYIIVRATGGERDPKWLGRRNSLPIATKIDADTAENDLRLRRPHNACGIRHVLNGQSAYAKIIIVDGAYFPGTNRT